MSRAIHKLSPLKVKHADTGKHADGGGLYLIVSSPSAKSWLFRWKRGGKRKETGLGSAASVSLAMARELAAQCRADLARGRDPMQTRRARKAGSTSFGQCCDQFIASKESGWRNAKHRAQWVMTLRVYAGPLRHIPVGRVSIEDVRATLAPFWMSKPETAARVRGRIERVLDAAAAQGLRERGSNPARLQELQHLLPKQPSRRKRVRHHPAMDYAALPEFMQQLRGMDSIGARALEFAILTAARTAEVLGTIWAEIDIDNAIWTVPGERMKAGLPHRVPLSPPALALVRPLAELAISPFVFPGLKRGQPLSNMAMTEVLRRMGRRGVSVHGFRSTFRQWCAERTNFAREVAEAALAHTIADEVEAAYQRSDLLGKRRRLMESWAAFCSKPPVAAAVDVVPIFRR